MAIKMFRVGKNWQHSDRVRETMLGEGMAACPVILLFKDHKNWENDSKTVPPTRHVASGNMGMNLHLSELLSDILGPVVGTLDGTEVISTEDLLALIDDLNIQFQGRKNNSWWEGKRVGKYQACEQFNGWLPTLDTCIRVEENNEINYKYYEKETCSKITVQNKTEMNENSKIQIISNYLIRRLLNTREELGEEYKMAVVEQYTTKWLFKGANKEDFEKWN